MMQILIKTIAEINGNATFATGSTVSMRYTGSDINDIIAQGKNYVTGSRQDHQRRQYNLTQNYLKKACLHCSLATAGLNLETGINGEVTGNKSL